MGLTLGALGVAFGDIGTSPLYAVSAIFFGGQSLTAPAPSEVIGAISLVIWSLTLVVALKYMVFVLRADNDGEGGVFALYALIHQHKKRISPYPLWVLLAAAGLLFGGGVITPAISVLSAVEGLQVVHSSFSEIVIPLTLICLFALFWIQKGGTTKIGRIFGPITLVWFIVIGALGLQHIVRHPEILSAFNIYYGLKFLAQTPLHKSFLILAAVMLVITGGEALYADLGHFGKTPIRRAWFTVVFPSLLLNYLGQGAFLLSGEPILNHNVFYSSIPKMLLMPVIILATMATIIASQALISGAFSLSAQATALGLFPRLRFVHTHHEHEGQVYSGFVNWALFIGCVILIFQFQTSTALGAAYGLAVSGDMLINSLAMIYVSTLCWNWSARRAVAIFGFFAAIDLLFVLSNTANFLRGGYVPLSIALGLFVVIASWRWGRKAVVGAYSGIKTMTMEELVNLKKTHSEILEKNAILMVPKPVRDLKANAPALFQLFWDRYRAFPRNLLFLEVVHRKLPYIHDERYQIKVFDKDPVHGSVMGVTVYFGFMEDPNVEVILENLAKHHLIDLSIDRKDWFVHSSAENILPPKKLGFANKIRFNIYMLLRQITIPGYYYYGLGDQVNLSIEILPVRL